MKKMNSLSKIASHWKVSEEEAAEFLSSHGLSNENLEKIAAPMDTGGFSSSGSGGSTMDQGGTSIASTQSQDQASMNNQIAVPNTGAPSKTKIGSSFAWHRKDLSGRVKGKLYEAAPMTAIVLGAGAVLGSAKGAHGLIMRAIEKKRKEENLEHAMKEVPELKTHNKEMVAAYHNLIYANAPDEFKHPKLIGQEIKRHLNYSAEGIPFSSMKDMVDIRHKGVQIRRDSAGGSTVGNVLGGLGIK
jgi:hypothetical protein